MMMKISSISFLAIAVLAVASSTTSAFIVHPSNQAILQFSSSTPTTSTMGTTSRFSLCRLNLYKSAQDAIVEAQRICNEHGAGSEACKVAWDIVEELEAADNHKNISPTPQYYHGSITDQTPPDIAALMASFDILITKIDGKMDQLKATTDRFQQLGANDPSIAELGNHAIHMKYALRNARNSLN